MATITSPGIGSGLDVNSIIIAADGDRAPAARRSSQTQDDDDPDPDLRVRQAQERDVRRSATPQLKLTHATDLGRRPPATSDAAPRSAWPPAAAPRRAATRSRCRRWPPRSRSPAACSAGSPARRTQHLRSTRHLGHRPDRVHAQGGGDAVDIAIGATDTLAAGARQDQRRRRRRHGHASSPTPAARGWCMRSTATGAENAFRTTVTDDDGTGTDARPVGAGLRPVGRRRRDDAARPRRRRGHRQRHADQLGQQHADRRGRRRDADARTGRPPTPVTDRRGAGHRGAEDGAAPSFVNAYNALAKLIAATDQVRRRHQERRPAAGRQHRRRPAAPAARADRRRASGASTRLRAPVRRRPRDAARRHADGQQRPSSTRRWPTCPS